VMVSLSIILSILLTMESSLSSEEDMEGSSLIVTLLSILFLDLMANRFASTLTALFYMSSRVT
jgi:hypothetical protein